MGNNFFIWVAFNRIGGYRAFKQKPVRNTANGVWSGDYDGKGMVALAHLEQCGIALPDLTWDSEPVRIKVEVSYEYV